MADRPTYYDIRTDFWRRHWEMALDYPVYLTAGDPVKAQRWEDLEAALPPLAAEQKQRLSGYNRRLFVLVSSGLWCGDCVRQGPMLRKIADAVGNEAQIRFIDCDASPSLADQLRILGGRRVPVVVFLSEEFFEVGRFGDRLLTVYRAKHARESGPACAIGGFAPPTEQLAAEQEEWVAIFERMLLMLRLAPALRERHGD